MKKFISFFFKALHIINAELKLCRATHGKKISICKNFSIKNPQYVTIGDNCFIGPNTRIEAWDHYNKLSFTPQIIIGDNVKINSSCHIGAINKIVIGADCLLGSHIMIIDHSHGKNSLEEIDIHPSNRDLYSKGDIYIGPKTWVCENAVILPNVHIGEGCVIAANTVVVHDVPPFSVVAGNPGRIVRTIK